MGGTDGFVKPGLCAMTRGIKIIPDLAPRAWSKGFLSAPAPPKSPPNSNSRLYPRGHRRCIVRNFQKIHEFKRLILIFLIMRTVSSSIPFSGQEGNHCPHVINGETEA